MADGGRVVNNPDSMLNAIVGSKIINRVAVFLPLIQQVINGFYISIGQKHIAGLRTGCSYMINAVLFFFGRVNSCFLMISFS